MHPAAATRPCGAQQPPAPQSQSAAAAPIPQAASTATPVDRPHAASAPQSSRPAQQTAAAEIPGSGLWQASSPALNTPYEFKSVPKAEAKNHRTSTPHGGGKCQETPPRRRRCTKCCDAGPPIKPPPRTSTAKTRETCQNPNGFGGDFWHPKTTHFQPASTARQKRPFLTWRN